MTIASPTVPDLEAERARLLAQCEEILERATSQARNLTDAEAVEVRTKGDAIDRIDATLDRIAGEQRRARFASAVDPGVEFPAARVGVRSEPLTYGRGSRHSYFADLVRSSRDSDIGAMERLRRHAQEVAVDAEARVRRGAEEYRDLTRVDGAGGQFVPPLHLVDQYVALARASRPTANIVNRRALPGGMDSINIPTVTTGTATAIQTADNAAVQETDLADGTIAAPVRTIAGQQDVAVQLLEQSPVAFDEVIFADLLVIRADDIWLWESVVRTRVLPDVGSGTLTTRLQAYQYLAMATRYPKAVTLITGTGLIAPTFT